MSSLSWLGQREECLISRPAIIRCKRDKGIITVLHSLRAQVLTKHYKGRLHLILLCHPMDWVHFVGEGYLEANKHMEELMV